MLSDLHNNLGDSRIENSQQGENDHVGDDHKEEVPSGYGSIQT